MNTDVATLGGSPGSQHGFVASVTINDEIVLANSTPSPAEMDGTVLVSDHGGARRQAALDQLRPRVWRHPVARIAVADAFAGCVFNLVHCVSPAVVVIGGRMAPAGDLLLGPAWAQLEHRRSQHPSFRATVGRAEGGDDAVLRGRRAYRQDGPNEALLPQGKGAANRVDVGMRGGYGA